MSSPVFSFPGFTSEKSAATLWSAEILANQQAVWKKKNIPIVQKYWDMNVLSMIPTWRKALKKAEYGMNLADDEEEDDVDDMPPLGWYTFSANYEERKRKAAIR